MKKDLVKKRFLITGATGFIGSSLARRLVKGGSRKVHILCRNTSDKWRIKDIRNRLHEHNVDLTDYKRLKSIIKKITPEVIFHCAVYGGFLNERDKEKIVQTNLMGTINLVNALSDVRYESFINTGSSSEYGIKELPMRESDNLKPVNLYGVTKASSTLFLESISISEKRPITTIRPFSVYGPYAGWSRLVPSVITSYLKDRPLVIRYSSALRDFVYIDDAVDLFLKIASRKKSLGIVNLGSGKEHSPREVVDIISALVGSSMKVRFKNNKSDSLQPARWVSDISKARRLLKWTPKTPLRVGLKKTLEWIRDNYNLCPICEAG